MPQITVVVTGLDRAQLRLDRHCGPQLERALGLATIGAARGLVKPMRDAAPKAAEDHRGRYPHKRGDLARSVKATRARRQDKPGAIVGPRVWWRHFTIVGTYGGARIRPNPWPSRVAAAHQSQTSSRFNAILHAELNR